ncbi:MAG: hypothetical protein LBG59_08775 [Candidatus Peribacteria bacterium]|jgi:predicted acylesterase/phospholipase RssA|nr:hypothetical protein [Candidatus Peribacteria bacterium]
MFKRFKRIFSTSTHAKLQKHPKKDRYILVLSGGGTRGFYTLGILKALEES